MTRTIKLSSSILLMALAAHTALSQRPTLQVQIPQPPQPVVIDRVSMAYYELRVTNSSPDTLEICQVKVSVRQSEILTIGGEELKKKLTAVVLAPAVVTTVYLEIAVGPGEIIGHEISYTIFKKDKYISTTYRHPLVRVSREKPPVLGAPFRDGTWAAIYDASWTRGHRRVMFNIEGVDYIPGRFAIDFMRLDDQWRYFTGDKDSIARWHGYANPVYAVADGVVVATRNDFAEASTLSSQKAHIPAADAAGNYVAIDIGKSHVVFYEHLKPGSVLVITGEKVKEGRQIGVVGFTGQSTGPHLHLHVATRNAQLAAEGVPFVFKSFNKIGSYPDFSRFGDMPGSILARPVRFTEERPGANTIINFSR